MPASLTASANPVGVWGKTASGTTTITWNTGSTAVRARVHLIETTGGATSPETVFSGDPIKGDVKGSTPLTVKYGSSYFLILRTVAATPKTLATLMVTVDDLRQPLMDMAVQGLALQQRLDPPQMIYDLKVNAGIDTCRVRFSTTQPTIPTIQLFDADGNLFTQSILMAEGLRTQHELLFGEVRALPQAIEFTLRIVASGRDFLNRPTEVTAKSSFRTGSRDAIIHFSKINVRKDGDPGIKGDGDFRWSFGAGDADTGAPLGDMMNWPYFKKDIGDDDPPVDINSEIAITFAPRRIWVQTIGKDDDSSLFNPGIGMGMQPTFDSPGSFWASNSVEDRAWVTAVFDISGFPNGSVIPMELATGDFGVAFTISGEITIKTFPGRSPVNLNFSDWVKAGSITKILGAAGLITMSAKLGGDDEDDLLGQILGRGPDGMIHRQIITADRMLGRNEGWTPAAPPVEGAVTAVAMGGARAALFAVDRAGAVLRADLDRAERPAEWHSLGGRFTGAVAAVRRTKTIELIAHDAEGAVFHRTVAAERDRGGEWQRIGEGTQREPIALALDDESFAVFALGRRGEVLMKRNRDGRWQSKDWQVIEGVHGVRLGAASIEGQGVALAVLDPGMKLTTLLARDERGLNAKAWTDEGDLQTWLTRSVEPRPERTTARKTQEKKTRPKIAAE